jgi:hypothetical protein
VSRQGAWLEQTQPHTVFSVPTEFSGAPDAGPDDNATAEDGQALLAEMTAERVAGLRAPFPDALS